VADVRNHAHAATRTGTATAGKFSKKLKTHTLPGIFWEAQSFPEDVFYDIVLGKGCFGKRLFWEKIVPLKGLRCSPPPFPPVL
jgi:hypothetical protein